MERSGAHVAFDGLCGVWPQLHQVLSSVTVNL